jgi:hypothetical protein
MVTISTYVNYLRVRPCLSFRSRWFIGCISLWCRCWRLGKCHDWTNFNKDLLGINRGYIPILNRDWTHLNIINSFCRLKCGFSPLKVGISPAFTRCRHQQISRVPQQLLQLPDDRGMGNPQPNYFRFIAGKII